MIIFADIPEFTMVSDNVNKMEGSHVELKCQAKAQPSPVLSWRKNGKREDYKVDHWYGDIRTERRDGILYLIFKRLKLSDAGNYTCEASNSKGKDKHTVNVAVYKNTEYPPSIVTPNVYFLVDVNSNATIICDVDGNPKPAVKWSKVGDDDGIISKEEKMKKKYRYSLIINKVQQSNNGTFQCKASNRIKSVHKNFVIHVTSKYSLVYSVLYAKVNCKIVQCNIRNIVSNMSNILSNMSNILSNMSNIVSNIRNIVSNMSNILSNIRNIVT